MFDVGFSELLLIAVVALVVFGPDRLPKMVRETSYWIRKARGAVQSARTELDREFQLMELRASMDEKRRQFLEEAQGMGLNDPLDEPVRTIAPVRALEPPVTQTDEPPDAPKAE